MPLRRVVLYNKAYVFEIIDLGANWFESATVDTNIITYGKRKAEVQDKINSYKISLCDDIISAKKEKVLSGEKECFIYPKKDNSSWIILNEDERSILDKIHKFKPLKDWDITINYGIKTGFNEAFIIDEATKERLIKEGSKSAEIIKPLLRGRDIKRYSYIFDNLYLICTFPALNLNIENYPAIKKYLESFGKRLEQSGEKGCRKKTYNKWFETQDTISYYKDFEKDKIVWASVGENEYSYVEANKYLLDTNYFLVCPNNVMLKYLIGVFNSSLFLFALSYKDTQLGDGGAWRHYKYNLEAMTVPIPNKDIENNIVELVDKIILAKKDNKDSSALEEEINKIVYSLYGLSDEEVRIVEGN